MKKYTTPFLGVAYYPEDWDKSEIAHDIEMMKKAGIKCARMAEKWARIFVQVLQRMFDVLIFTWNWTGVMNTSGI